MALNEMNFLDLFSGIGGFALGARMAGLEFQSHWFSEIDQYAIRIYEKRFPESSNIGDITGVSDAEFMKLKEFTEGDWLVCGGFPCQDISIAGKGYGINGKRSGLWSEMFRSIRILRPRFTIIENVGAITFRGLDRVLADLASIGYDAEWQDIRASDVGAPHRRERIWIVAYANGEQGRQLRKREKEIIGNGETMGDASKPGLEGHGRPGEIGSTGGERRDTPATSCSTIRREWGGAMPKPGIRRVADGIPNRVDRLRCLGNSIVPQIAELILKRIKKLQNT